MERVRIPLYKVRQFGEKIGDTFAFVNENLKPLLKYLTYFLLPLALLTGLVLNGYMDGVLNMAQASSAGGDMSFESMSSLMVSYGGVMLMAFLVYIILPAVVYGLMRIYGYREQRLVGLTWDECKPVITKLLKRSLKFIIVTFLLALLLLVVYFGLVWLLMRMSVGVGAIGMVVLVLVLVVFLIPFTLAQPVYLFEDNTTVIGALKKSFRLGMPTWGGIFAVTLVLSIIVGILSGIVSMPWTIAMVAKATFGIDGGGEGFVGTTAFSFMTYLLGVVQTYFGYLCYTVLFIGIAYQYGHAAEKIDHVTVDSDIEQFDTL